MVDLYKDGVVTYCVFVNKVVNFYDFNREKLVRMEEDGEESDEISDTSYHYFSFLRLTNQNNVK